MRRIALWVLAVSAAIFTVAAGAAYWLLSGDGIRVALESQASAWLGQPVRIASATGRVFPRLGINLGDVRIGEPARMTLADVELSASLRALLSRRIDEAEVIISDSRIELPLPNTPSSSENADADASSPAATGGAPIEIVSVRRIALRDIVIASRGREVTVSADAALAGSDLQLERLVATSGRTRLEASGTIQLDPRIDARLEAVANRLDLDELLALAAAFQSEPGATGQRSAGPPSRIRAHITAESASAASVEVRTLVTDLTVDGQRVTLDPLTFELFDGTYAGSLQATLGDALDVRLSSKLANLDVAQLAAFGGVPDTITGRLSASGTFNGRGADVASMLEAARGNGSATILDGTISRLNLIRTVVLFFGRPEPNAAPGADKFDRIQATFSLAQQTINASEFSMRSPDSDIDGRGSLSLASKALDGTAELRLSEALSKQAGTDLVRYTREGNRVLLPARISGNLSAPRITIDAAAAAKRGIRNEVERRIRGLFNRSP
jgi:uncharacterized protein involved in outer membrane biogenesis